MRLRRGAAVNRLGASWGGAAAPALPSPEGCGGEGWSRVSEPPAEASEARRR